MNKLGFLRQHYEEYKDSDLTHYVEAIEELIEQEELRQNGTTAELAEHNQEDK